MGTELAWGTSPLLDLLFEDPHVGRCLIAPDGSVLRANAEWLRSTGFALDDVLGVNIIDLFPETRDMARALHARVRASHRVELPRYAQRIDGPETWWDGVIEPVPMENGTGLLITARSVQQGKRAVDDRSEWNPPSDDLLDATFASMSQGVMVYGRRAEVLRMNVAAERILGIPFLRYKSLDGAKARFGEMQLRAPDGAAMHEEDTPVWRALHGEAVADVELRIRRPADRQETWLSASASAVRGTAGEICGAVVTFTDITERRRAEEALRESEARFRALADGTPVPIWTTDVTGRAYFINRAYCEFFGTSQVEITTKGWQPLIHPDDAPAYVGAYMASLSGRTPFRAEARARRADGEWRWIESVGQPRLDANGRLMAMGGSTSDVTERKRAELIVRESEERVNAHLDNSPLAVVEFDPQLRVTRWSKQAERLFGWSAEEIVGRAIPEIRWIHEDDVDSVARESAGLLSGERPRSLQVNRNYRKDGSVVLCEWYNSAIYDRDRRLRSILSQVLDITERKRAEEALREADRRKDEFLGMLSHELRNPLAPIRNSTYILQHAEPGSEQARRAQSVIQRQTEHLTRLVDDLLDVTRIARGKIELRRSRVDLRDVVSRAAEDFRVLMPDRGVRFDVLLPDGSISADADATRVTQVIGNLLHNASKFTRRGDSVTLSIGVGEGWAEIRVRDTGAGIDAKLLPTIFEPFVQGERTLARTEGGLGLGLALVKGIVELHGGSVRADSAGNGKGSEFVVRLPVVPSTTRDEPPELTERRQRGLRVLVVDDNPDAAESLADLVAMLGHTVEVAYDGPTAIAKARATPPNVVLCDIGLPGMTGYEVAKALRIGNRDGMLIFAVSGYARSEDVQRAIDAGFDGHVAKPCDPHKIERLLS